MSDDAHNEEDKTVDDLVNEYRRPEQWTFDHLVAQIERRNPAPEPGPQSGDPWQKLHDDPLAKLTETEAIETSTMDEIVRRYHGSTEQ